MARSKLRQGLGSPVYVSGPIHPLTYMVQVLESPNAASINPQVSLAVVGSHLTG